MANTRVVSGICVYNRDTMQILNFTVTTRNGNPIPLIAPSDWETPYKYKCLNDLYRDLLLILKENHFRTLKWFEFGAILYDIIFIDSNHPEQLSRFYYHGETK